jgi:hypothetical protein
VDGPEVLRIQAAALRALEQAMRPDGARAAADSLRAALGRAQSAPTIQSWYALSTMRPTLADLYLAGDRPAEALALLEPLSPARPAPRIALLLARSHEALGHPSDAIRYYSIFLEGWRTADDGLPDKAHAERALARLTAER